MKHRHHYFLGSGFVAATIFLWVVGAILSLLGMSCIVYILYRVATHPW